MRDDSVFGAALLAALVLLPPGTADATPSSVVMPRIPGHIAVDGDPSEEAWSAAAVVDSFYEIVPGDNVEPPVRTVGLLGYDSEFLYVGVRCQDPDPSSIRAPYVDRDHVANQDLVQIDLDARDEGRWSMIFRINPRGVQADGVFDEATGVDDFSPDFHFESAARVSAEGWSAEMKIPLATLRYRGGNPQTWRITFFRLYPREFRRQIVSNPVPRGSNCWLCHAVRFTGIEGLPRGGSLALAPFLAGGRGWGAGETGQTHELGGDVKWLPQPNLAVDLTLNPDFSQVEADVPQIGVNTRFALFYPEKRPFFLEGLDLWNSPISAVHTRTITAPDWGTRLTGRPGNASYTLLAAGDQGGGSLVLPGPESSRLVPQPEDALVLLGRYRYNLGRSSLGLLATGREAGDYFNRVAGADFQWYPTGEDRLTGQLLWSATRDTAASAAGSSSGHALLLAWERSQRQFDGALQLEDIAAGFRADSGFVPQTGVRRLHAASGYNWYPLGFIRKLRPQIAFDDVRQPGGRLVSQSLGLGVAVDGRVTGALEWHPGDRGRGSDGRLFEPSYGKASARFLPHRRVTYVEIGARHGEEIDFEGSRLGQGTALSVLAALSPTDRLQAEITGERRWLDVEDPLRVRLYTASVARLKVTYAFTARSFTRLVGEWERLDEREAGGPLERSLGGSILYGYRLNWQSILYLGYENSPVPSPATSGRRQEVFIKLAYAFRP